MVSKKTAGSTENSKPKAAAKKVSLKSSAKKAPSKSENTKASGDKVLNAQVPVRADVNPVKDVLEIKAHNAEKKAIKEAAKALKKEKAPVNEKGTKVVFNRQKVAEVKENARKTAVKKFVETKTELKDENGVSSSKSGLWTAFINGYKNMFNYSGRTSRYEFWAFMLSNLIAFCVVFPVLLWGTALGLKSGTAVLALLIIGMLIEVLTFLSLTVRRLHDTGVSAWKNYFKPVIISIFVIAVMTISAVFINSYVGAEKLATTPWQIVSVIYGLVFLAFLVTFMYYTTKISIVSSYYEGEISNNLYGVAEFNDDYHKAKGLQYTVLCMTIVSLFYMMLQGYTSNFHG